ncbi:MAG: hypothetical protein AAF824_23860 [Bacteroidota bacterium]
MFKSAGSILLYLFPAILLGQSDQILLSASFSESIDLRVTNGANISWIFTSIEHYKNGFQPLGSQVSYEVSSTVNFSIQLQFTPLTSASGDVIDSRNLVIRPAIASAKVNERGDIWQWTEGDWDGNSIGNGVARGDNFLGSTLISPTTILVSGPNGNAGSYNQNQHKLLVGIGTPGIYSHTAIGSLLDQNIKPGIYTGTITLTALASTN